MDRLSELLSRWVTSRDRIRFQSQIDGGGHHMDFLRELSGHAEQLGTILPELSQAQMEALAELSASWLGEMRLRSTRNAQAFRK